MTKSATSGGVSDSGGWIDHRAALLPARLFGASEEEKRAAKAAGGIGQGRLRYRVVTKEQLELEQAEEESNGQRQEPESQ